MHDPSEGQTDRPQGTSAEQSSGKTSHEESLTVIPGIAGKTADQLLQIGVNGIEDLAGASPDALRDHIPNTARPWETLIARANAHCTGRPVFLSLPHLPDAPRIFLDIETGLRPQKLVWLIGVYTEPLEEVRYFCAEHPDEETAMLKSFLDFLRRWPQATLCYYSTQNFDKRILNARLQAAGLSEGKALLERSLDVGHTLTQNVALPTRSFKLQDVAEWMGFEFSNPQKTGLQAASAYIGHVKSGLDIPDWIFTYNRDDVLALREIVHWLEANRPTSEESRFEEIDLEDVREDTKAGKKSVYLKVVEKWESKGQDEVLVLRELGREDINRLMSVLYQRHNPKQVKLEYSKQGEGMYSATIADRE